MGLLVSGTNIDAETLRRRSAVLGSDHLDTYRSRNALAMDLRECGNYLAAGRLQQDSLPRQQELFGADHPYTIGATRNLAVILRKLGDHAGAVADRVADLRPRFGVGTGVRWRSPVGAIASFFMRGGSE